MSMYKPHENSIFIAPLSNVKCDGFFFPIISHKNSAFSIDNTRQKKPKKERKKGRKKLVCIELQSQLLTYIIVGRIKQNKYIQRARYTQLASINSTESEKKKQTQNCAAHSHRGSLVHR